MVICVINQNIFDHFSIQSRNEYVRVSSCSELDFYLPVKFFSAYTGRKKTVSFLNKALLKLYFVRLLVSSKQN